MTEYYPRDIADAVRTALENMPVVIVTGMRQTGKTTFLRSQPKGIPKGREWRKVRESLERKYTLETKGSDFEWLVRHVAKLLNIESEDVLTRGKYKQSVKARGLLCYWGTRKLGMTTVESKSQESLISEASKRKP